MSEAVMQEPGDEGQEIAPGQQGSPKRRLDPGAKRNLIIVGGVALLAVGIVGTMALMSMRSTSAQTAPQVNIGLGAPTSERRGADEGMSPRMAEQLAQRQNAEATQAAQQGRTYIPPDLPTKVEPVSTAPSAVAPSLTAQNSAAAQGSAAITQHAAGIDEGRLKGLERFLATFEEVGSGGEGQVRSRFTPQDGRQGQTTSMPSSATADTRLAAAGGAPAAAASSATNGASKRLVEAFSVMAARLAIPLEVPEGGSGTVLAEIVAGPFAGSMVAGTARVVNEGLEIRFNQARLGRDAYGIQAIGLDGTTSSQVLGGSVDRKVFQRYVIPMATAAAQGYFTARALVGSAVVGISSTPVNSTGATGTSTAASTGTLAAVQVPAPTARQAAAAGMAAGMQVLSQDAARVAATPIVVSIPSQTPMGVLFVAEVFEKGAAR